MLTDSLKGHIRQFVLDFLETLKIKVGPDHEYIDSVQFSLEGKSDKGHKHKLEEIDGYRFPHITAATLIENGELTVNVAVSKIRGYDMSGAVFGIDWAVKGQIDVPLPPLQTYVRGEFCYKFSFGQIPFDKFPLMVQAYMKDQNDLDVDVRSSVRIASIVHTGTEHD